MFTITQWVVLIAIFICCLAVSWFVSVMTDEIKNGVISVLISIVVVVLIGFFMNWYNTSTASGIRAYKDHKSNLSNGIDREITITAEDGREIFHYEGKVDVESNHTDNYIKFESEEGKRYIIYYGIQDTITIIEK